jgi:3-methylcrotonyl-CoA carboxylase alpha subunit
MIKAAHGGGGKGMRIVREAGGFAAALESCQREAANAFGRDRVLLEHYVESPRHIEIQVFGDAHGNVIHLNERECSAQRRYQKVLEESPSPFVTPELRAAMGAAAVQAARAIDYANAGTVEFIVAPSGDFFFMEINTRLQVEHPVTEMTTGLDLVEWQLQVAAGAPLPLAQAQVPQRGHAIEVRLYAEDPEAGFLPGSGKLERLRLPAPSAHVRIDSGVVEGDTVTIFYDPMIAKLVVHDADRAKALARMREALAQCEVAGPKSNIAFLERLVRHPAVVEARIDTGYLDRHLDEFLPGADAGVDDDHLVAAATARLLLQERAQAARAAASGDPGSPWALADGWRLGHAGKRLVAFLHRGQRLDATAHGHGGRYRIQAGIGADAGAIVEVDGAILADGILEARFDGAGRRYRVLHAPGSLVLHDGERRLPLVPVEVYRRVGDTSSVQDDKVRAPMPGRVVVVRAARGDSVVAGQELLVIEAMKMELALKAPRDGKVASVPAVAGEFVEADTVLLELEA